MIKTTAVFLAVISCLLTGCSKKSHVADSSHASEGVAPDSLTDWGVIRFSAGIPEHLKLNDGRDCTLTAKPITVGNVQAIQIVIETEGKTAAGDQVPPGSPVVPIGTPTRVSKTMIIPVGGTIAGYIDKREYKFTAKLKAP